MMFSKSTLFTAAMLSASAVDAHMLMANPVPYSQSTLNNSPLAADGSDFPCKLRDNAFEAPATENVLQIGVAHPLSFTGSATHGGGSCQISLTTDLQPSKSSSWMVIKSFEGGCPANVDGNLSGGASSADPYTFNFTVPDGISAGKYTLAWTWFNRIGNREMYMNCAPVTVSGGSSSKRSVDKVVEKRSSFPNLFVANINGCTTSEGVDIRFPDPGSDIEYDGEPANLAAEGSAACTGTPTWTIGGSSSSSGSSGSSGSSSASVSTTLAVSASSAAAATSTGGAGVFAEGSGGVSTIETASAATTTTAAASVAATTAAAAASETSSASSPSSSSSSSSSSTSSSGTLSGSCSPEGAWNCDSGSSFQRCANGVWTASQPMAAGTECTSGVADTLTIKASSSNEKRGLAAEMRHRKRMARSHSHA